jgi:hypothetical protein
MKKNIAFSNHAGRWFGAGLRTAVSGAMLLLFTTPGSAAERQVLRGHVPEAVARLNLQPVGRLPATNRLNLAIGLPLRHTNALSKLLQDIYDPASAQFRHYLTPEQFTEHFGPTQEDYEAVVQFAKSHGLDITATHSNRVLLDVAGRVADIEKAFQVRLHSYQHPREGRKFYAPDVEPSLDLATPVLHVSGLNNYLLAHPMSLKKKPARGASGGVPQSGSGPDGAYMGPDFRAAYVPGLALTGAGQSVGLFEEDGFYPGDITNYASLAGVPAVPLKVVLLDGFNGVPGEANVEVALDIDMAICMAPGLSSVIVYEGFVPDDILNRMATDGLANQLSASWTYPVDPVTEQIFLQFQAQGQSYFNASGDGDAWVDGIATPCDDPNITSVGGTTLTTSGPAGAWVSETVWNWDVEYGSNYDGEGSGGGISTTYAIPPYQTNVSMTANHGSIHYRNIPDVALTADNVIVVADDGTNVTLGGTSCAAPLWAGFVALANEQAAASGRPPLGFINPAIYALGGGADYTNCFHDITTGSNTWSESPSLFRAVAGYDLCTGWGTPMGSNLVNVLAPPDSLQISPLGGVAFSGAVGGPLAPASQSYVLTNTGNTAFSWAAATTESWLNVSLSGGTLTAGGAVATVVVSLNAAASNLFLGTYGATVWFTNLTDGTAQSRAFSLSVIKPPVITAQPAGLTLIEGETATFTADAAGGLPLTCQWQSNGINLTDGGRVSGSQTTLNEAGNIYTYGSVVSTLTISNVAAADGATYTLVASNAAGVLISSNALLAITPSAPVIVAQPASQAVFVGATVQLAAAAVGTTPLTFQWEQNGANLTDGGGISGSLTPVLTITGASSASIGTYTVVVSNALSTASSTGAVLTVLVIQPGAQLVQNGGFETGNFSFWNEEGNFADCTVSSSAPAVHSGNYGALLGSAGSLGYLSQSLPTVAGSNYLVSLWLDSPDGIAPNEFLVGWNGSVIFDQTNLGAIGWTNLLFPYVVAAGTNTLLQFGFRDDESFLGLDDIQVTPLVSADGPPIIATQPASQVALSGSNASFSVLSAGRLPLTYQWQFEGVNLANATNATLALTNLTTNQTGTYAVLVSNSLGWTLSSNALLTVLVGTLELITFDDLTNTEGGLPVPDGYNNLVWSNFYCLNGLAYGQPSGYTAGVVSASNIAYNGYGAPAAINSLVPFDLLSAYLTAAWNDDLHIELQGYSGATLSYDNTYILSATAPTFFTFNYMGVTSVQFISFGGTPHPGYAGSGEHFVMDNLSVLFPPSPPIIGTQPANAVAVVGGAAAFSVSATGTAPLSYFWNRNGAPIAGATASSYTTNNVQLADSGSQFSCLVSNAYGMALSSNAVLTVTPPSLVKNGGFETGTFSNWTASGNSEDCSVSSAAPYVHSGEYGAQLGPVGSLGYLSQTLATSAGQMYEISCWLYCGGQTPNEFTVSWNGARLFGQQNIGATLWTNLQFQASATATATVLQFGFRNDPSFLGLDDIAVYPIIAIPPQFRGVTLLTNGVISFSWGAQAGDSYQVQYTTNLAQNLWTNLSGVLSTTNSSITATDVTAASTERFYRIVLLP